MLISRISGCKFSAFVLIDKEFGCFCLIILKPAINFTLMRLVCYPLKGKVACLRKMDIQFVQADSNILLCLILSILKT